MENNPMKNSARGSSIMARMRAESGLIKEGQKRFLSLTNIALLFLNLLN
jgi:hypothetical protein